MEPEDSLPCSQEPHFETRKILQQTNIWSWVPIPRMTRLAKASSNLLDRIGSDPVYREPAGRQTSPDLRLLWDSRLWRRGRRRSSPPCCKPLRSSAELIVRKAPAREDRTCGTRKLRKLRRWKPLPDNQSRERERADWEKLVRVVVNWKVYELATSLELLVVTNLNNPICSITNPKPVYSHVIIRCLHQMTAESSTTIASSKINSEDRRNKRSEVEEVVLTNSSAI
jgi:hypothetical protein